MSVYVYCEEGIGPDLPVVCRVISRKKDALRIRKMRLGTIFEVASHSQARRWVAMGQGAVA
jgi:hypothetical protein